LTPRDAEQPIVTPTHTPAPTPATSPAPAATADAVSSGGGGGAASDWEQQMLDEHNLARRAKGLPPMSWDESLRDVAREWVQRHASAPNMIPHRSGTHSKPNVGENIAWAWSSRPGSADGSARRVVGDWVSEEKDYNYATNTCRGVCGHYTQVVWRDTSRVGCAQVQTPDGKVKHTVCNYSPAGNYVGEKPY